MIDNDSPTVAGTIPALTGWFMPEPVNAEALRKVRERQERERRAAVLLSLVRPAVQSVD